MKKLLHFAILSTALSCLGADISGIINYSGSQTGVIHVTASQSFSGNKVLKVSGAGTVRIDALTNLAVPDLTIQFWFKGASVQSAVRQQVSGRGYIIAGYNGGHLTSTDGFLADVAPVTDGNWHHVVMTRKQGVTLAGYVDGQFKGSIVAANAILPDVRSPVYFGSRVNGAEFMNGMLDEIAIWNRELSAAEIAMNWSSPPATNATGLVGYWKFDDDTCNDSTANGYDGTPLGDATIISDDDIPSYSQTITVAGPGPYTMTSVPMGSGFSMTAFLDVNGDGIRQSNEPSGAYTGNPFTLSGNQSGVNITLTETPYITHQPQSPPGNRAAAGGNVSFSVTALGTAPLGYQWYRGTVALVDDARISGATSANLQITGLLAGDAGGYSCVITNAQGHVASQELQLSVITNPETISGNFIYNGTQTGQVHTTIVQLRTNYVLNLSNTATNYALTTLTDLSGDELSIEYWFKGSKINSAVRQQASSHSIVSGWGPVLHVLSNDGGTSSGLKISDPASVATNGNWHHVAMTWKRNTVNGFASYLDGDLVEQRTSTDVAVPNIGTQVFFGSYIGTGEFANGMLDEIAIWGAALTQTEIRANARDGLTGSETGLKGYWNFDDGLGQDLTPQGNHAELRGGATTTVEAIPGQGVSYQDVFVGVGPYTIMNIPAGNNYLLFAFLDSNGNGTQDTLEPHGVYAGNPFDLVSSLSGADIILHEPPSIPTNPASVTVLEGGTIQLSVVVEDTSNLLQWQHYSTPLADGDRVSGAQSNSLMITGALLSDAGAYSVMASNPAGVASSLAAAVIVQPAALTNHLIAHWKLDETTGTLAEESTGLSQNGTLFGFPGDDSQWVTGIVQGSLSFSHPTNQNYVIASDYAKPTNTMAVSAWVWADSRAAQASIAKNYGRGIVGQFHFGLDNAERLSNYLADDSGTLVSAFDTVPLPLANWQHVAFVADGVQMRLYRNGVEVAVSAPYNGTLLTPPMVSLGIGVKTDDTGTMPSGKNPGFWHGKLDDLGIWNRALSADEIFGLYWAGLSGEGITQASAVKPITLAISVSGNQVTIYYAAGSLEWAKDITGSWTTVPGASPPSFTTNSAAMHGFFRVR